jgi:hypothetical protein
VAAGDGTVIGLAGTVVTAGIAVIGWLGKRLYDSPRPQDVEALRKERDALRQIVDSAADKAARIADERETENRKLQQEIGELRVVAERLIATGSPDGNPRSARTERVIRRGSVRHSGDTKKT